jgi:hypothetical protein
VNALFCSEDGALFLVETIGSFLVWVTENDLLVFSQEGIPFFYGSGATMENAALSVCEQPTQAAVFTSSNSFAGKKRGDHYLLLPTDKVDGYVTTWRIVYEPTPSFLYLKSAISATVVADSPEGIEVSAELKLHPFERNVSGPIQFKHFWSADYIEDRLLEFKQSQGQEARSVVYRNHY